MIEAKRTHLGKHFRDAKGPKLAGHDRIDHVGAEASIKEIVSGPPRFIGMSSIGPAEGASATEIAQRGTEPALLTPTAVHKCHRVLGEIPLIILNPIGGDGVAAIDGR